MILDCIVKGERKVSRTPKRVTHPQTIREDMNDVLTDGGRLFRAQVQALCLLGTELRESKLRKEGSKERAGETRKVVDEEDSRLVRTWLFEIDLRTSVDMTMVGSRRICSGGDRGDRGDRGNEDSEKGRRKNTKQEETGSA